MMINNIMAIVLNLIILSKNKMPSLEHTTKKILSVDSWAAPMFNGIIWKSPKTLDGGARLEYIDKLSIGGKAINPYIYRDLMNPTKIEISESNNLYILSIEGGDGSYSYASKIYFTKKIKPIKKIICYGDTNHCMEIEYKNYFDPINFEDPTTFKRAPGPVSEFR